MVRVQTLAWTRAYPTPVTIVQLFFEGGARLEEVNSLIGAVVVRVTPPSADLRYREDDSISPSQGPATLYMSSDAMQKRGKYNNDIHPPKSPGGKFKQRDFPISFSF